MHITYACMPSCFSLADARFPLQLGGLGMTGFWLIHSCILPSQQLVISYSCCLQLASSILFSCFNKLGADSSQSACRGIYNTRCCCFLKQETLLTLLNATSPCRHVVVGQVNTNTGPSNCGVLWQFLNLLIYSTFVDGVKYQCQTNLLQQLTSQLHSQNFIRTL